MEPISAFQALLLSAQLADVDGKVVPMPSVLAAPAPAAAQPAPKPILRVPLKEIVVQQERAAEQAQVGRGSIDFKLGLDPQADLWVKFKQGNRAAAHALADLEKGVDERFPVEAYHFAVKDWIVRAYPLAQPQSPQANVSVAALLRQTYELAEHVRFEPVEYAMLFEDGGLVPASLSLVREDRNGVLQVTYNRLADVQKAVQWFLGVDGILYGMKVEGVDLVFYSEPVPPKVLFRAPEKALPR
ncbi:MAG: hypothetical protein HY926_08260 [Elusimicrobia bacterium]|nr:hypothetical protein [Elusimicrobiota bacterium]